MWTTVGILAAAVLVGFGMIAAFDGRARRALDGVKLRATELEAELKNARLEARAREAELHSTNQLLSAQKEELAAKNQRLEELGRRRGALVATLSHDLRSPLNSLLNLSDLMAEGRAGALSTEQRRYVDLMHRSAERLLGMINDVLDLSRIDAGRADLDIAAVDLESNLWAIAQALWPDASKKGVVIRVDARTPLPAVLCDEDRLRQVLTTLVRNGVRFTEKGHVDVVAEVRGSQVTVGVSDTGVGMPEQAADRIFQDLWEVSPASGRSGGTVLGLTIARRLIELMGGELSVHSEPGKGTSFTFTLPVARDVDVAARAPQRKRLETPTGAYLSADVLVIDDDEFDRADAIKRLQDAGFDAVGASTGREGLRLLAERAFDAVVLDLIMPEMNGLDVITELGRDERLARTPIVVLSSMYMTKMEREILGPSVAGVVLKGEAARGELAPTVQTAITRRLNGNGRAPESGLRV